MKQQNHGSRWKPRILLRFFLEKILGNHQLGGQTKILHKKTHTPKTRWWQLKYFLFSPRSLGRWSKLTCAYFSNGLVQPPSRKKDAGFFQPPLTDIFLDGWIVSKGGPNNKKGSKDLWWFMGFGCKEDTMGFLWSCEWTTFVCLRRFFSDSTMVNPPFFSTIWGICLSFFQPPNKQI